MTVFAALLRAVNVGGTRKLAMADLRALCEQAGFERPETYIQSGNVVFGSRLSEAKVVAKLEDALAHHIGRPVGVLVRAAPELESVLERNPFPEAPPNRVLVLFVAKPPGPKALVGLHIPGPERVALDGREVFIHYPDGQGRSKLKLKLAEEGTARNLNTVGKLVQMTAARR